MTVRPWCLALAATMALGCGEETEDFGIQVNPPPAPAATSPKGAASADEGERKPLPIAQFTESDFVESEESRDPFRDHSHLFAKRNTEAERGQRKVKAPQFALDELKLTGIIGRGVRAIMLTDPNGFGWMIYPGEYVGKAELVNVGGADGIEVPINWRVDRIRADKNDVVFIREDATHPDIPPTTRVLPLYPTGDEGT